MILRVFSNLKDSGVLWELWVQVGATRNADSSSLQRSFLCRWRWWEAKGELTSQFIISYTFQPFKQALRNNFQLFAVSHTFPALRAFPQWPLWPTGATQTSPHPRTEKTPLQGPPIFQGELENVKETDSMYLFLIKYWMDETGHRQYMARKRLQLKWPQCSWLEDQIPGVLECSWSHSTWERVLLIYMLKLHFLTTELRTDSPTSLKSCGKSLGGNISGEKKNPYF